MIYLRRSMSFLQMYFISAASGDPGGQLIFVNDQGLPKPVSDNARPRHCGQRAKASISGTERLPFTSKGTGCGSALFAAAGTHRGGR